MLTLTSISKTFSGGFRPVLTNINLHLKPKDFCMMIGGNGSGKSTLIKMIAGEYVPDTGTILIEGDDLTNQDRSHAIASVTQDVNQGTIPEMTLLENMTLSLLRTKTIDFSFYHRRANQVTQEIKALGIGLEHYLHTPLSHLSGGQRQMVATIMAVTSRPKLLLLDEHTSALDPSMHRMVMTYTAQAIAHQRLTSLMITHHLDDAIHYGNRLMMLHKGQIVLDVSGKEKSSLNVNELLALVAYAIVIPFRLLNFPDLTAEGAYPLGGAVCSSLLVLHVNPLLSVMTASFAAGLMGVATSLIHLRLKVNSLLAGIILSTMMYSVNLHLLGKPNIGLFNTESLFNQNNMGSNILLLLVILMALVLPLALFLRTQIGLRLRAVGFNQAFARRQSISVARYTVFGLFIAGCFTGIAGGLMVQLQYYMDVGMGIGIVIHGLAALMIGEAIVGNSTINRQLIAPFIGALGYQQIQGVALFIGLAPADLKFFTGGLVLLVIALQRGVEHESH